MCRAHLASHQRSWFVPACGGVFNMLERFRLHASALVLDRRLPGLLWCNTVACSGQGMCRLYEIALRHLLKLRVPPGLGAFLPIEIECKN